MRRRRATGRGSAPWVSRSSGGRPDDYAVLTLLNWWDTLFTFAGQVGASPLRDRDTRGNFAAGPFGEALAFYVSLFADGLAPRVLSTEIDDPLAAFAQGYFAVYPNGPSLLLDLHRRRGEIAPEPVGHGADAGAARAGRGLRGQRQPDRLHRQSAARPRPGRWSAT